MNRQNDGRKSMPKLNCPYCGKRFADVPSAQFKNKSELVKLDNISADDFILECPHCHKKAGLHIDNINCINTTIRVPYMGTVIC